MKDQNMYGIICNARKGKGIGKLALVDRSRCKRLWWTSDDANIAICYRDKKAAEFACGRLHKNNPQVVPFGRVQKILNDQRRTRADLEDNWEQARQNRYDEDLSWDAHKAH